MGIVAGYIGGVFDWVVTRLIDFFSALPWYLVVLYLVMVLPPSLENLILAMAITSWVGPCRLVRGLTFSVREQDYVEAARALGIPRWRILVIPHPASGRAAAPLGLCRGHPDRRVCRGRPELSGHGGSPARAQLGADAGRGGPVVELLAAHVCLPGLMITLSVLAFQGLADGLRTAIDVNVNI